MRTGCIDITASTPSHFRPSTLEGISYQNWLVETSFSAHAMTNPGLMEGICGIPIIIDVDGNVSGFLGWIEAAGTEA